MEQFEGNGYAIEFDKLVKLRDQLRKEIRTEFPPEYLKYRAVFLNDMMSKGLLKDLPEDMKLDEIANSVAATKLCWLKKLNEIEDEIKVLQQECRARFDPDGIVSGDLKANLVLSRDSTGALDKTDRINVDDTMHGVNWCEFLEVSADDDGIVADKVHEFAENSDSHPMLDVIMNRDIEPRRNPRRTNKKMGA